MLIDESEPRPLRGETLRALTREDLDLQSVEELKERISILEGEIERVRKAIDGKASRRTAADALFNFDG